MSLDAFYEELDFAERKVASNKAKISRLKNAKTQLKSQKDRLDKNSSKFKNDAKKRDTYQGWCGTTQQQTQAFLLDTISLEYKSFIQAVDNRLDAVCDEITRLENENYRLKGRIGYLVAEINSLINEIETALN